MFNLTNSDEPPLRRFRQLLTRLSRRTHAASPSTSLWTRATYWLLPVALVVSVSTDSIFAQSSYSSDLRNYVTIEPKIKTTAFNAIDAFTPIVEESRDAEPIVVADTMQGDLVVSKTNPVKTDSRVQTVTQPVVRTEVVTHTVGTGETLSGIAAKYDISVGSIRVENSQLVNVDALAVGDSLRIPPKEYDPTYIASTLNSRTAKSKSGKALASAKSTSRTVTVRSTSNERYDNAGQPAFQRPAGALGRNGYHSWALDIPPSGGTTIRAAASGVVVEVASGWNGGYGNMILVDHGGGWQTLYAHLASIGIDAGNRVDAGTPIGIMGATGRTYPVGAVHLHFEIRKNGQRLNPVNFIE